MNYFVESVFQSHPLNSPSISQLSRDSEAAQAWLRVTQGSKKEHTGPSQRGMSEMNGDELEM